MDTGFSTISEPTTSCYRVDEIVAAAGQLVKLDQATELLSKSRYAYVVIEIDLAAPLVLGFDVLL